MPIHFAAARCAARSPVARALARKALRRAANDNPGAGALGADAPMVSAALRHFAAHGLRAAEEAAMQAQAAQQRGERDACLWWTAICHKLDRGMARDLTRRMTAQDLG